MYVLPRDISAYYTLDLIAKKEVKLKRDGYAAYNTLFIRTLAPKISVPIVIGK